MTKLKLFSEKVRQSTEKYLNLKLVIGSILENGFEATLRSKMNGLSIWKSDFALFFKFISDKIETVFWKSKENFGELCKIKVSFKKHSRK